MAVAALCVLHCGKGSNASVKWNWLRVESVAIGCGRSAQTDEQTDGRQEWRRTTTRSEGAAGAEEQLNERQTYRRTNKLHLR